MHCLLLSSIKSREVARRPTDSIFIKLDDSLLKISSSKNAMKLSSPKSYSEKVTVLKKHRILTKRSPEKAVAQNKYLLWNSTCSEVLVTK